MCPVSGYRRRGDIAVSGVLGRAQAAAVFKIGALKILLIKTNPDLVFFAEVKIHLIQECVLLAANIVRSYLWAEKCLHIRGGERKRIENDGIWQFRMLAFVCAKVEDFVFFDGTADRSAKLIDLSGRPEPVGRNEIRITSI